MPGRLDFEIRFATAGLPPQRRAQPDDPFRVLVIGDFSGGGDERPSIGPAIPIDVDNFDRILARVGPRLSLSGDRLGGDSVEIGFQELDDFHPERLIDNLPVFAKLRDLRRRLLDPSSFEQAARELSEDAGGSDNAGAGSDPGGAVPDAGGAVPEAGDGNPFERLLGGRPASVSAGGTPSTQAVDSAARLIARLVEPHITRGADPDRQRMLVAAVDDGIAGMMRAVLHDPGFQALESAWRGLRSLVSGLETGEDLQIFLLDASRRALTHDFAAAGDNPAALALDRLLVNQGIDAPDGQAWSLVIGDFTFGPGADDIDLLAGLGAVAARAGGAMVAAADPALLGCLDSVEISNPAQWDIDPEAAARWQALRASPVAARIALAVPRLLLRLPYGARTDPVTGFDFEEMSGAGHHAALLWGNPAFGCALLIGRSFQQSGWAMVPGDILDLDDLPAYVTVEDGESTLKPCAELLLSRRTAEAILAHGVMPMMSHANRNAVRLARVQSIADPPTALTGPWE